MKKACGSCHSERSEKSRKSFISERDFSLRSE
jgi:hypothetical protein